MLCYLRVSIAGGAPRVIILELDVNNCPMTSDNFAKLCSSAATAKRNSPNNEPTYRGTDFHRIIPGFMIQGGDFTKFDGSGGFCAPATNNGQATFPDESFVNSHCREGVLSMANKGPNTNGSQFFITLAKQPHLDKKHCAFGTVVEGMDVVHEIAKVETENERPTLLQRCQIVDCGLGRGTVDSEESSSACGSSGSSLRRDRRKKSKKSKHQKRKHRTHFDEREHKRKKRKHKRSKRDYSSSDDDSRRRSKSRRKRARHRS